MQQNADNDADWQFPADAPYWRCQECGHTDHNKPMPADRTAFYAKARGTKCPKCKSEAFVPVGW